MPLILHVLHVLGAVFVIGPMTVVPMLGLRAIRRSDPSQMRGLARSALGLGVASVVVAALGFGVMSTGEPDDDWSFTTHWILWSAIVYVAAAVVHFLVVVPVMFSNSRIPADPARSARYGTLAASSGLVGLLLVVVVILMVAQPS